MSNPYVDLLLRTNKFILSHSTAEGDRGMTGVRDEGTLDYIATHRRPKEERSVSRTAWVLRCIATMHPFFQGNKRTAFAVAELTLMMDERSHMEVTPEEGKEFMLNVAMEKLSDAEIDAWIKAHRKDGRGTDVRYAGLEEIMERHAELFRVLSEV